MELYRTIYDPNGVSFEVPPDRAADLVLNKGWTNTQTEKKTATKKNFKKVKAADELAADTEEVTEDDPSSLSSE